MMRLQSGRVASVFALILTQSAWAAQTQATLGDLVCLPFSRGEKIFTSRKTLDGHVDFCVQKGLNGVPRVLISGKEAPLNEQIPLTDFSISDDGRLCAYFVQQPDTRYESIQIIDTNTGRKLRDTIFWTHFSDFAWRGAGFYYGGYRKPESNDSVSSDERVLFHRLGQSQDRDQVIYEDKVHTNRKYLFLTTYDHQFFLLHILERIGLRSVGSEWVRREGSLQQKFQPLQGNMELGRFYLCDNVGDHLVLFTRYKSPKGRIIDVDTQHLEESHWKLLFDGPINDAEPMQGKMVIIRPTPSGGAVATVASLAGKVEKVIPSEDSATIDVQYCSAREKYVFVSVEKAKHKQFFLYNFESNSLVPFK